MSEILEFENLEETVREPEDMTAEAYPAGEIPPLDDAPQNEKEQEPAAEPESSPDPFGPVNTGSIPFEVPAASESGYVSPYSEQSAAGIGRQTANGSGGKAADRAGFWPRLFAFLIDALVSAVLWAILMLLAGLMTDRLNEPFFFSVKLRTVLLYIAQKLYYVTSESMYQKTLGKKALRLELISSDSSERPTLWTVFFREVFGKFVSSACVIGDLMILGKEHLPLYDRLADTEVVYTVNRNKTIKEDVRTEETELPSAESGQRQETEIG